MDGFKGVSGRLLDRLLLFGGQTVAEVADLVLTVVPSEEVTSADLAVASIA